MSVRSLSTLALALGAIGIAQPARAQDVSLVPSPVTTAAATAPVQAPAAVVAPAAGPTLDAATVAVRHVADADAPAAARRSGSAPGVPLMIVGGAAIIVGLLLNSSAGGAIAVGGAVVGLIGLYQYLQ